jgi:hypothetical protein
VRKRLKFHVAFRPRWLCRAHWRVCVDSALQNHRATATVAVLPPKAADWQPPKPVVRLAGHQDRISYVYGWVVFVLRQFAEDGDVKDFFEMLGDDM